MIKLTILLLLPVAAIASPNLKITGRLQGSLINSEAGQDIYVRRARVNFQFNIDDKQYVYTDVRSDRVNLEDQGEGKFSLGDFYWSYKLSKNNFLRIFRTKVDMSYTQTSSSKDLTTPERASIADFASNYVSEARRASNIQFLGNYKNWSYQFVIGDGVNSKHLVDLSHKQVSSIENQKLIYGTKLRYYFFDDTSKQIKEVFTTPQNSLSIGLGIFSQNDLRVKYLNNEMTLNRVLSNIEVRGIFQRFHFLFEHFKFTDDLIDLSAKTIGESAGYYLLGEYFIDSLYKKSIYFRLENHDRNLDQSEYDQTSYLIGFNHYLKGQDLRIGILAKKLEKNKKLAIDDEAKFNLYITMNY